MGGALPKIRKKNRSYWILDMFHLRFLGKSPWELSGKYLERYIRDCKIVWMSTGMFRSWKCGK